MNLKYVSDSSVLVGAEFFEYSDGLSKGVRAARLYNGRFSIIVILDKAMNIFRAEHLGENFAYISKNGLVSPKIANTDAIPFLQSFDGGLLYLCGLENIGSPSNGNIQHGRISNLAATNVHFYRSGLNDDTITLTGEIRVGGLFSDYIVITRTITLKYGSDEIEISDNLKNIGHKDAQYSLIYHFNFGYPLICENTTFTVNSDSVCGINEYANQFVNSHNVMSAPIDDELEKVFCHSFKNGIAEAVVENDKKQLKMTFDTYNLPVLIEWKSMASGDYVLGIEPATSMFGEQLVKKVLKPSEEIVNKIKIELKIK